MSPSGGHQGSLWKDVRLCLFTEELHESVVFNLKRTVFKCWTLLTLIQMIVCDSK